MADILELKNRRKNGVIIRGRQKLCEALNWCLKSLFWFGFFS